MAEPKTKYLLIFSTLDRYWPRLFIILLAFLTADLLVIEAQKHLMIEPTKIILPQKIQSLKTKSLAYYQPITSRNAFSLDGNIPETLFAKKAKLTDPNGEQGDGANDIPVPSMLPLTLIGTIVHSNPQKSVANVEYKSKNLTLAIRVGNTIADIAKLESVERGKIFIRNLNNHRLEYLELKEMSKLSFNTAKANSAEDVKQVAPNKFEIARSDITKYTSDLSNILQQAAMLPAKGPSGEIEGFRFVNIQPDSIYTKLGFQIGDVIKGVNGEKVDSPAKALELYNTLKTSNQVKILMDRGGKETEFDYNVK